MKIRTLSTFGMAVLMAALLLLSATFAAAGKERPMTPELAAKKENVRAQRAQRPSDDQRVTSANSLKEERRKVYMAKQLLKKPKHNKNDAK
jgi:hypothetical protein